MAERKGTVALHPRGPDEFGWNPIFIPDGAHKTWAEMSSEEQKSTSLRRLALSELQHHLEAHYR
jgi:inosine/xanthosine triphosphate pyrophosphatase family protein